MDGPGESEGGREARLGQGGELCICSATVLACMGMIRLHYVTMQPLNEPEMFKNAGCQRGDLHAHLLFASSLMSNAHLE